ncbi:MAG: DUF4148 domain-containing protein [Caldimonas sp.]
MSSKSVLLTAIAVVATFCWQSALAQASAPVTRADVKAETRAAEKAGKLTPAGQGGAPAAAPLSGPTKTRAQRKAETREARKAGTLAPAGSTQKADDADRAKPTTRSRVDRKSETRAAAKAGDLTPAGEGPAAPKK